MHKLYCEDFSSLNSHTLAALFSNPSKRPSRIPAIARSKAPATLTKAFLPRCDRTHKLNPSCARQHHPGARNGAVAPPGDALLRGFSGAVAQMLKVGLGWAEACARMHNRLMHTLNGNTTEMVLVGGEGRGPNCQMSLSQTVSLVPPVPEAVKSFVSNTPLGIKYPMWHCSSWNTPQIITALALIEQSPAGRAWGVKLAHIPIATDSRHCRIINEGYFCVSAFFKRSGLSHSSELADVKWENSDAYYGRVTFARPNYPIKYTCDAVARMIYAAQEWQVRDPNPSLDRPVAVERRLEALEARIAALESQNSKLVNTGAPAVTCLMYLFQGHTSGTQAVTSTLPPDIPPHTERISDLSDAAEDWLRDQLKIRKVWVKVNSVDSAEENHISWAPLEAGEEVGTSVIRKYGIYRFWYKKKGWGSGKHEL